MQYNDLLFIRRSGYMPAGSLWFNEFSRERPDHSPLPGVLASGGVLEQTIGHRDEESGVSCPHGHSTICLREVSLQIDDQKGGLVHGECTVRTAHGACEMMCATTLPQKNRDAFC